MSLQTQTNVQSDMESKCYGNSFANWQSKGINHQLLHGGVCEEIASSTHQLLETMQYARFPLSKHHNFKALFVDSHSNAYVAVYLCSDQRLNAPFQSANGYFSLVLETKGWSPKAIHLICNFDSTLIHNYVLKMSGKSKYDYRYSNVWYPHSIISHIRQMHVYCFWRTPYPNCVDLAQSCSVENPFGRPCLSSFPVIFVVIVTNLHCLIDYESLSMVSISVGEICTHISKLCLIMDVNNLLDDLSGFYFIIDCMKAHAKDNILLHMQSKKDLIKWLLQISKTKNVKNQKRAKLIAVYIRAIIQVHFYDYTQTWKGYYQILHYLPKYITRKWTEHMRSKIYFFARHHDLKKHSMLIGQCANDVDWFHHSTIKYEFRMEVPKENERSSVMQLCFAIDTIRCEWWIARKMNKLESNLAFNVVNLLSCGDSSYDMTKSFIVWYFDGSNQTKTRHLDWLAGRKYQQFINIEKIGKKFVEIKLEMFLRGN